VTEPSSYQELLNELRRLPTDELLARHHELIREQHRLQAEILEVTALIDIRAEVPTAR
jgi:hypothetical protein